MITSKGPCPAKIMLVGEFPTPEEVDAKAAFAGYSMKIVNKILASCGIMVSTCFRTCVLRDTPKNSDATLFIAVKKKEISKQHVLFNGKYVLPKLVDHVKMLEQDIKMCQPNVILAFGNLSLFALTGEWGITSWRGSILPSTLVPDIKVIPSYSPQQLNKMYSWQAIAKLDYKKVVKESKFKEINSAKYNFILDANFDIVIDILGQLSAQLDKPKSLGIDIETKYGYIECIALAWSPTEAICIPFVHDGTHYWTEEQELRIVLGLCFILSHKNLIGIGQNFVFDYQYIFRDWFCKVNLKKDTMIAQHSMFSSMPKDLSFLSSLYLPTHKHWKEDGKGSHGLQRWDYNCRDACDTLAISQEQDKVLAQMGLVEVEKFQQELFPAVIKTMTKGVRIDWQKREEFDIKLQHMINDRQKYLKDVLGYVPNIKSPPQMQALFYKELGQKAKFSKKTGNLTCDDEALNILAKKEPLLKPLVTAITELRSLGVFLSTFVRAELSEEGRMLCEYKVGGTKTYRFASNSNCFGQGTNLQNIPDGKRSTTELPNVRELFIPDTDRMFYDVDLDSADLRIVAKEANIEEMVAMLAEGKKVYVEVMKEYYHNPAMTKHDKEYTIFKSLCHGTHYLGTSQGLAERLGLLVHEIEIIQKWYFGKFPNLKKWQDEVRDQVFKRKMVSNVLGYRNYLLDRITESTLREAIAWIPQSTVACIINKAYKYLDVNHPNIDVLLQVHDSLSGQFPIGDKDNCINIIQNAAEVELPYKVPMTIPAEVHVSEISWGHCK